MRKSPARQIIEAIRAEALFKQRLALPVDAPLEREVASAVLCGYHREEDLEGITAADFVRHDLGAIYAAALSCHELGAEPTNERMLVVLGELGFRGDLLTVLEDVRNAPAAVASHLRRHVERLIGLARARRALVLMDQVEAALRTAAERDVDPIWLAEQLHRAAEELSGAAEATV